MSSPRSEQQLLTSHGRVLLARLGEVLGGWVITGWVAAWMIERLPVALGLLVFGLSCFVLLLMAVRVIESWGEFLDAVERAAERSER